MKHSLGLQWGPAAGAKPLDISSLRAFGQGGKQALGVVRVSARAPFGVFWESWCLAQAERQFFAKSGVSLTRNGALGREIVFGSSETVLFLIGGVDDSLLHPLNCGSELSQKVLDLALAQLHVPQGRRSPGDLLPACHAPFCLWLSKQVHRKAESLTVGSPKCRKESVSCLDHTRKKGCISNVRIYFQICLSQKSPKVTF